ncbi:protein HpaG [Lonepinella koalarum]|uniref:fumarylacetoacetate hydrolase family protein n=1 Tax=Lonepinella koalarum TaxID=53417 RepID=UPI0011E4288C|nr:fumarylacetoacetate hydrolase family protein [Lonepinella koalarum]TYG34407.1 protein HpaG [Lonepinella koalarum]
MTISLAKQITQLQPSNKPTVFVIALNSINLLKRHKQTFEQAPYKGLPQTPVIYVLPEATHNQSGATVVLPKAQKQLRIEPHLGVVFNQDTARISEQQAMQHVGSFVPVVLYSLPNDNYYRPDIMGRCQPGFCVLGQSILKNAITEPERIEINVQVNNTTKKSYRHLDMAFSIAQLISVVSQFISFKAGDILLTGTDDMPIIANANDDVTVDFVSLGVINNQISA